MKKILIGLLAVFAACNTSELPDKKQESIQTYSKKDLNNGYTKNECKHGKCFFDSERFYRFIFDDGNKKPCITKYAYAGYYRLIRINDSNRPPIGSRTEIITSNKKDCMKLYKETCRYYEVPPNYADFNLNSCKFFRRTAHNCNVMYCMEFDGKYVKPLTKVEAEEYLKNHPETVELKA